jgi:hypothetical protein
MKLGLKATYDVDGKSFDLVTADQSTADDTENDIERADIGLHRKAPSAVPDQNRWLSDHIHAFTAQMTTQLVAYWTSKFCTDFKAGSMADAGNRAYECLRLPSAAANPPEEVNEWHLQTFGLPAVTVQQMIGAN